MAPKLLKGLAKIIKVRKKRSSSTSSEPPTVITVLNKPEASRGASSTTCYSSGYFSEPFHRTSTIGTATTTTTPKTVETMEEASITWCGSGSDSDVSSPVARRPEGMIRRCKSHTVGTTSATDSFRLRKRNRALSDVDFDELLTASRGWTFDPSSSVVETSRRSHTRQNSLAQTDFERYIFAPTDTADKLRDRRSMSESQSSLVIVETMTTTTRCETPPPPPPVDTIVLVDQQEESIAMELDFPTLFHQPTMESCCHHQF